MLPALASEGFRVVVLPRARRLRGCQQLADALLVRADLAVPVEVERLVAAIKEAGRLDVLVNNTSCSRCGDADLALEDYDAVAAQARGTWYLTKPCSGASCCGRARGASST